VGPAEIDHVVYTAGFVALALVALCALVVFLAALVLRSAARRALCNVTDSLETLRTQRTGVRIPRLRAWPLVEVRLTWEEPDKVAVALEPEGRWLIETITARERGRRATILRRFRVADVLGLSAVSFRLSHAQPIVIAPAVASASAELSAAYALGGDLSHPAGKPEGDLIEMRKYGPGDSLRHVLWKTFARTRRLLVRVPERAMAPRPVTVAFLVAGAGDEATSAVARLYLDLGLFGPDFLFCADGAARPARQSQEALTQIIDSVNERARGGASLEMLAAEVEPTRLASCLLFAPPIDGPWRARLVAFARRLPSPPTVVIGVEGATVPPAATKPLARLLFCPPAVARVPVALGELRQALEGDGLRVQVVHRQTGQLL
jgi:uncharacterized protein (DUF58 family)